MSDARALLLSSLAVGWAASCAVFPDEAVLPLVANAGAAGEPPIAEAGAATFGGAPGAAGNAGLGGEADLGGASAGGAPEPPLGGAGGAASACASPSQDVRNPTADAWIESALPKAVHGTELLLGVLGGDAQRALVQFLLPRKPVATTLVRAEVRLHLESNADATLAERHLEMSLLEQQVDEDQATWENWGQGNRQWDTAGGDFGLAMASATLSAPAAGTWATFDVTAAVDAALSTAATVPFPLIVLEVGAPPTSPAELAFSSREGDDLVQPQLLIEYCQ